MSEESLVFMIPFKGSPVVCPGSGILLGASPLPVSTLGLATLTWGMPETLAELLAILDLE